MKTPVAKAWAYHEWSDGTKRSWEEPDLPDTIELLAATSGYGFALNTEISIGISVPADATHALLATRASLSGTMSYTAASLSCCGDGLTELLKADGGGSPHAKILMALGEITDTGAGHTVNVNFSTSPNDSAYSMVLAFFKAPSIAVRDSDLMRDDGGGSGSAISVDTDYHDLVVGVPTTWNTGIPEMVGYTRQAYTASGNDRMGLMTLNDPDDTGATLPTVGAYAGAMLVSLRVDD